MAVPHYRHRAGLSGHRAVWLNNFAAKLPGYQAAFNLTAAEVTAVQADAAAWQWLVGWVEALLCMRTPRAASYKRARLRNGLAAPARRSTLSGSCALAAGKSHMELPLPEVSESRAQWPVGERMSASMLTTAVPADIGEGQSFPALLRHVLGLVGTIMTCGSLAAVASPSQQAGGVRPTAADQFKDFIANPPVIEDLKWALEWPGVATNYDHLLYQSNAVFLGQSTSPQTHEGKYDAYQLAIGRFANEFWFKGPSEFYVWTNHNIVAEHSNVVEYSYLQMQGTVSWALNVGCFLADPGTIRWTGDTFVVTNRQDGLWLLGSLRRDEKQRAASLSVEARRLNRGRNHSEDKLLICDYFYDRPVLVDFLPSRIRVSIQEQGEETITNVLKIFNIRTNRLMLPKSTFDFLVAQVPSPTNILVVSNEFVVGWDGRRQYVFPDPVKSSLSQQTQGRLARIRRVYIGLALAGVAFGPIAFLLGRKWVSRGTPAKQ